MVKNGNLEMVVVWKLVPPQFMPEEGLKLVKVPKNMLRNDEMMPSENFQWLVSWSKKVLREL